MISAQPNDSSTRTNAECFWQKRRLYHQTSECNAKKEKVLNLKRETLLYLIFGVLTTVISIATFTFFEHLFMAIPYAGLIANVLSFILAASFAFITNKLYVFESKSLKRAVLMKEIPSFFGARLLTFGMEELGLVVTYALSWDTLSLLGIDGIVIAKVVLSVIGVILNYLFSKFFIFKKKT